MSLLSNYSVTTIIKCLRIKKAYSTFCNNKGTSRNYKYNVVRPNLVTPQLNVGQEIIKPDYWESGIPSESPKEIEVKTNNQLIAMKDTCFLAKELLNSLKGIIKAGITTDDIDTFVHRHCIENKAYPSPLNYHKFPKSVCTSVNNVACHGIPDKRPLENGDILNVDITVYRNGLHGDCSGMFLIGEVDEVARHLCLASKKALESGISVCKPGRPFSAIGKAVEDVAKANGFSVVPAFLGHGIGSFFHGPPDIYHFDTSGTSLDSGWIMEPGMTFTIEPVLSEGGIEITILDDGWTAVTVDDSRTAQWEHTVVITKDGVEILC